MSVLRFFSFSNNNVTSYRSLLCIRNTYNSCEEQRAFLSGKMLEKLGIPSPPKRPLTPYLRFSQTIRPKILERQPDLKPSDTIKIIAQEWSKCDSEKKKLLQKEFLADMEIYIKSNEAYKQSITPEQKNLIESTKIKQKRAKEQARIHEKKESLGKPKKPVSAFIKFLMEKKQQKDESLKYTEWVKRIAREWEIMPEDKKQKYQDEAKMELDQYKNELIVWEENMIRQGHIDVVRHKDVFESKSKKTSNKNTI